MNEGLVFSTDVIYLLKITYLIKIKANIAAIMTSVEHCIAQGCVEVGMSDKAVIVINHKD